MSHAAMPEQGSGGEVVYPPTLLFTEGVTVDRVMRVAGIIPAIMRNNGVGPSVIERHATKGGDEVEHLGWPIARRGIEVPDYRPEIRLGGTVMTFVLRRTLYVTEEDPRQPSPVLSVCSQDERGGFRDSVLTPDRLRSRDDSAAAYAETASIMDLMDGMHTRGVATYLTLYALRGGRQLMDLLQPHAVEDPLPPNFSAGGPQV